MNKHLLLSFMRLFLPVAALSLVGSLFLSEGVLLLLLLAVFAGTTLLLLRSIAQEKDSAQRFQVYFNNAMLGMATTSINQQWLEVNPALCRMLGYSEEELRQKTWAELTHPDDLAPSLAYFEAISRGERDGYEMDKRYIGRDGRVINAHVAAHGVRQANGNLDYFVVIIENTSAPTLAQEALQVSRERLRLQARRAEALLALPQLADNLDERAFMQQALHLAEELTDSQISFMHFVNDDNASIELVAWSKNTLDKYCSATFDCHYPITSAGIWADAARDKKPLVINDYLTEENKRGLPEGHSSLQRLLCVPVLDGDFVRMITGVGNKASAYSETDIESVQLISNITWRIVTKQRADKALRIATQVVNASSVVCFRWRADADWPVDFVSENVVQWGYSPAQLLAGKPPFSEMVHPDDRARVIEEVSGYTAVGMNTFVQEYRLLTGTGQTVWIVDRTNIVRNANGDVEFYDGVLSDISDRKQQEQKQAENLAALKQLNKRLEDANNQLLQSEKMASIGQLAAGIAHELNNPIGFVHSNMGTLDGYLRDLMDIIDAYDKASGEADSCSPALAAVDRLKEDRDFAYIRQDIVQLLSESKDGLSRVRKIVHDLKNFSRVGEQEWQVADLHQGIDSTLNIVWNELKYKCTIIKEYGDIPQIDCLISQLNQVFMNLLVNAGHAIETQGEITIRTSRLGDNEVQVEICDTGKGIAPENIHRIFEPFFTTKPVGKGTGLGLSLSYGIIQRHHGRIEVDSQLGHGTCFRVILPIKAAEVAAPSPEASV